ncbi:MAG: hypothetical protein OXC82_02565 [Rhodobacteraceae bacterium]|nr:hypothetical protein [Paracoccaceae bacterium]MCY4249306.1 hypothetical protein [Paracoccaceae bacterium]
MHKNTKATVDQKQPNEIVKRAVEKVIRNPKNSKAARTAAGLGLAHRRNHFFRKPGFICHPLNHVLISTNPTP